MNSSIRCVWASLKGINANHRIIFASFPSSIFAQLIETIKWSAPIYCEISLESAMWGLLFGTSRRNIFVCFFLNASYHCCTFRFCFRGKQICCSRRVIYPKWFFLESDWDHRWNIFVLNWLKFFTFFCCCARASASIELHSRTVKCM